MVDILNDLYFIHLPTTKFLSACEILKQVFRGIDFEINFFKLSGMILFQAYL